MPSSTSKNQFKELLADLKEKYSYRDLTAILKEEGLGSATGWDKLLERFEHADKVLAEKAMKVLTALQDGLIFGGNKSVFIFELDEDQAKQIAFALAATQVSVGNYSARYPSALSPSELKQLSKDHELVHKVVHSNGDVSMVLCAKRTQEERVVYDVAQVTEAVQVAFSGYDEFIAVRRTDYQVFDVLTLRRTLKRLEVLVDHPDRLRGSENSELRCLAILGRLSPLASGIAEIYEKNLPLNLVSCIGGLYRAKSEGRVTRLSFRSPTKSVNKGAMTSQEDLRKELFHKAGVAAVGEITPYDVTVVWDSFIGAQGGAGVQVSMPISGLSSEDCYVREARIVSARSDSAVVAVLNKLVSYSTS